MTGSLPACDVDSAVVVVVEVVVTVVVSGRAVQQPKSLLALLSYTYE